MNIVTGIVACLLAPVTVNAATGSAPMLPFYEKLLFRGQPIDCVRVSMRETAEGLEPVATRTNKIYALIEVYPNVKQLSCQSERRLRDAPTVDVNTQPLSLRMRVFQHMKWVEQHAE